MMEPITEECISCICTASTGCDETTDCTAAPGYCGPYLISWAYWCDAGKPTKPGLPETNDYVDCATDMKCAADTVKAYMTKLAKDCNGDGVINCVDYAMMHKFGGYFCEKELLENQEYFDKIQTCTR